MGGHESSGLEGWMSRVKSPKKITKCM